MRTAHPGECLVCDFSYGAKNSKGGSGGGGPRNKHPSYYVRQHMAHAHLFGEYSCHRLVSTQIICQITLCHYGSKLHIWEGLRHE